MKLVARTKDTMSDNVCVLTAQREKPEKHYHKIHPDIGPGVNYRQGSSHVKFR